MRKFTRGKVGAYILLFIAILFTSLSLFTNNASAAYRRSRTYTTEYQAQDSGRYRNTSNSALWNQVNALSGQPVVVNVRIPILLGVKVTDLEDTWGDARSDGRTHEGIDILVPRGTIIVSPTDAIVTTVENSGNGGNHVFTANPGGERYYYAHLESFAAGLAEGQTLKAGDIIGYVGNTGNAAGGPTHLHFGIYQDDHNAINPFPRLTLEFSLADRMAALTKILSASADQQTLARSLVGQYRPMFAEAQATGIALPTILTQVLAEKRAETLGITRTLKIGIRGEDVKALQASLGLAPDGVFGPKTQAALILFQRTHGLAPDGVFGPASRAALAGNSSSYPAGCTSTVGYSPTTGIKCTTVIYY